MIPNFKREIKKIKASLGKDTLEIENSVHSGLTGRRSLYVVKSIKKVSGLLWKTSNRLDHPMVFILNI